VDINSQSPKIEEQQPSLEFKVPRKLATLAKTAGINLNELLAPIKEWALSVEKRFAILEQELPKRTAEALMKVAEERQRQQIKQMQASGQTNSAQGLGGISPNMLMQVLPAILGSGGSNTYQEQLTTKMMQLSIKRMEQDMSFTEAIKNAIVSKIAGKTVGKIIEEG
jgi:hypothetical protein